MLLIHFSIELNKLKNYIIRNKIKVLINNLTNKDLEKIINNQYYTINDLLTKYIKLNDITNIQKIQNNINKFIKNIIITYQKDLSLQALKSYINNKLDQSKFLFDNLYIYNILEQPKDKAIKELKNILDKLVIHSNKLNIKSDTKIITLDFCGKSNNNYYCKNNKFIISKENYLLLLDILYYDLTNPFKQILILNLVNYNLNNIYKFQQNINEKIYIYL